MPSVLITGASRGIGRAAALLFGKKGYKIGINYLNNEPAACSLARKLKNLGVDSLMLQGDVSDRAQVRRMFSQMEYHFGGLDVLVNNAGIAQQKVFTEITDDDWDKMFSVHVKGTFYCCQYAIPLMQNAGRGSIINLSSMWGQVGGSCEVHYSAAKAAVIGMTKALAKELGLSHIRVNCVAPGVINTDMNDILSENTLDEIKQTTPLGCIGTPEDAAEAILFLAGEESRFITGQVLSPNGGFVIG
jgi:3-oxoacyl-[acyl-carrier protein] reductase